MPLTMKEKSNKINKSVRKTIKKT